MNKKIIVAGLGYVGLSNAVLLAQQNKIKAIDLDANSIEIVNTRTCPIVDTEMESILPNKELDLSATTKP